MVAMIGISEFTSQFELVTTIKFSSQIPLFTFFFMGFLGNYFFLYKLWRKPPSIWNNRFAIFYVASFIIASTLILIWLFDVKSIAKEIFDKVEYPSDVDEVTFRVRLSLLDALFWLFFVFESIGLFSLFVFVINSNSLSKAAN